MRTSMRLSSRIGLLQAHVMRLDALGRKLVHMASIDTDEFDFDSAACTWAVRKQIHRQGASSPTSCRTAIDELGLKLKRSGKPAGCDGKPGA